MDWAKANEALERAIKDGWIIDLRDVMPRHKTKKFRRRRSQKDIFGKCDHHSASTNQIPEKTGEYHVGSNHVSEDGCPAILYTAGTSQLIYPGRVLLFNDLEDIPWSQGKGDDGQHEDWSGDENRHLLSFLVFGDFDEGGRRGRSRCPSVPQLDAREMFNMWSQEVFGFGDDGMFSHSDFGKAYCPGHVIRSDNEALRRDCPAKKLVTGLDWQEHLLRWRPGCLPKYGPDGDWGNESRAALSAFEREHFHKVDGRRDPFIQFVLLKKYAA